MTDSPGITARKPLRLWPGVVIAALQGLLWFVLPAAVADMAGVAIIGALGCAVGVLIWWLFFSRAPWAERIGAVVLMAAAVAVTSRLVHPSIANGMMGMMLPIYSLPVLSVALVAWAVLTRRVTTPLVRYSALAASVAAACAAFTLIRTDGITGGGDSLLHWRWTPTAEELLLARAEVLPASASPGSPVIPPAAEPASESAAEATPAAPPQGAENPAVDPPSNDAAVAAEPPSITRPTSPAVAAWPGFRGPGRDAVIRNAHVDADWTRTPPTEMWRRPIGPGWSSFAVQGNLIYTQEQRGDDEVVSCYRLTTGAPVWRHSDRVRFWESNGGAGPRATPALRDGRVYAMGATGIVNALDARTGAVAWTRDAAEDTGATLPGWGFAGSPLPVDDLVVVAASGRLIAYDAATGKPKWKGPAGGGGYSSPHLATIDGVTQILLLRGGGLISVSPSDGAVLWEHAWEAGASIVQPAVTADGDVLLPGNDAMGGIGMRRLAVARNDTGWTVTERWTSRGLKPYFNDFVVHEGLAFGFDGSILAAIDLSDGSRNWKGGRYGHGQMVLLPEQDALLVLSEEGGIALVSAGPQAFSELARAPAIEGKTWNHPVVVGDVLLVRNGEEMAAFRLPRVKQSTKAATIAGSEPARR